MASNVTLNALSGKSLCSSFVWVISRTREWKREKWYSLSVSFMLDHCYEDWWMYYRSIDSLSVRVDGKRKLYKQIILLPGAFPHDKKVVIICEHKFYESSYELKSETLQELLSVFAFPSDPLFLSLSPSLSTAPWFPLTHLISGQKEQQTGNDVKHKKTTKWH